MRLIGATNRDLERAVASGRFREDLYYRVAVFRIHLATLRGRDDVLLLAERVVRELSAKMASWPGNVRELQNVIERALMFAEGALSSVEHLGIVRRPQCDATRAALTTEATEDGTGMLTIAAQERRVIVEALQRTHGHQARVAALLGVSRFQPYSRLKRYRIE